MSSFFQQGRGRGGDRGGRGAPSHSFQREEEGASSSSSSFLDFDEGKRGGRGRGGDRGGRGRGRGRDDRQGSHREGGTQGSDKKTHGESTSRKISRLVEKNERGNITKFAYFLELAEKILTEENGSLQLLECLGSANGLAFLKDLCDSPFSIDAGGRKDLVSFQGVAMKLFNVLSNKDVRTCISKDTGIVIETVLSMADFRESIVRGLEDLIQRGSARDLMNSTVGYKFSTMFEDLFLFIQEAMRRNVNWKADPDFFEFCTFLQQLHHSAVQLEGDQGGVKALANQVMSKFTMFQEPAPQKKTSFRDSSGKMHPPESSADLDGPGELSFNEQPRHDNDPVDFRKISITPTMNEIFCDAAPYLPKNAPWAAHHIEDDPLSRLLDLHFRLFREDVIGPLRMTMQQLWKTGGIDQTFGKERIRVSAAGGSNFVDLFTFHQCFVERITGTPYQGLTFEISFLESPKRAELSPKAREEKWERSKLLKNGSLVCLWIDFKDEPEPLLVFATICKRDKKQLAPRDLEEKRPMIGIFCCGENLERLVDYLVNRLEKVRSATLLQASESFFSYEPVLKSLQNITDLGSLEPYLTARQGEQPQVNVPHFFRNVEFLDLRCLAPPNALPPTLLALERVPLNDEDDYFRRLSAHTTLDPSQAAALRAMFLQEIACIQGPPGTGKSYIGVKFVEAILANARHFDDLGPILCVTYTNHALDQFLEHLLDSGIDKIVRIGSRSKSERLESCNLREITKNIKGFRVGGAVKSVYSAAEELEEFTEFVGHGVPAKLLYPYLQENFPDICSSLFSRINENSKEEKIHDVLTKWTYGGTLAPPTVKIAQNPKKKGKNGDKKENRGFSALEVEDDVQSEEIIKVGIEFLKARGSQLDVQQLIEELGRRRLRRPDGWKFLSYPPYKDHFNVDPRTKLISLAYPTEMKKVIALVDSWQGCHLFFRAGDSLELVCQLRQGPQDILYVVVDEKETYVVEFPAQYFPSLFSTNRPLDELLHCYDAWAMSHSERKALMDYFRMGFQEQIKATTCELILRFDVNHRSYELINQETDRKVLSSAKIIGMTTSGAARFQAVIASVRPRIVIVEEAGEITESHVLASLSSQTQNLILIGDHQQLRPKCQAYYLSSDSNKNYNVDKSMFERLIEMKCIPLNTLSTQRRMRPEIADLIRSTIYKGLRDSPAVKEYPETKGMTKNIQFMNHTHRENDGADEDRSKWNAFEVDMCVALAKYMLQQGYKGRSANSNEQSQVTILTPYLGQLMKIHRKLEEDFFVSLNDRDQEDLAEFEEDVDDDETPKGQGQQKDSRSSKEVKFEKNSLRQTIRCATIDNFQGEESEIIIISLVRNNARGKVGFLKIDNRINVLLSRAKHGMFIIGNVECLAAGKSPVWDGVLDMLSKRNCVADHFELCCAMHHDVVTPIREVNDFKRVPQGGCFQDCGSRLTCGHTCKYPCHPHDREHKILYCEEKCARLRPLEECPFRHPCRKLCGLDCGPCEVKVPVTMPRCGHEIKVNCFEARKTVRTPSLCSSQCGGILLCGHRCASSCGNCSLDQGGHAKCSTRCGRALSCGHNCQESCHPDSPCPPCSENCSIHCSHNKCTQKCADPCAPCLEQCSWKCKHAPQCSLPCGFPCNRLPCNKRCENMLSCKHRCPSLCGEPCPKDPKKSCPQCCDKVTKERVIDFIESNTFGSLDEAALNEDPVIFLECGHFYQVSSLDGCFSFDSHYVLDKQGNFLRAKPTSGSFPEAVCCPECRAPILLVNRYKRIINQALVKKISKVSLIHGQRSLESLQRRVDHLFIADEQPEPSACKRLFKQIEELLRALSQSPCKKLNDAVVVLLEDAPPDLQIPDIFPEAALSCSATNLLVKCKVASLHSYRVIELQHVLEAVKFVSQKMQDIIQFSESKMLRSSGVICRRCFLESSLSVAEAALAVKKRLPEFKKEIFELLDCAEHLASSERDLQSELRGFKGERARIEKLLDAEVTQEEKNMILKAMGHGQVGVGGFTSQGHWYECPNGHPYVIGDCGGAMQESKCPECGATIGGGSHRLHETNRVTAYFNNPTSSSSS